MTTILKTDMIIDRIYHGQQGLIADVVIQRRLLEKQKLDLRIILLGGTNVGKSTLVFAIL